MNKYKLLKRFCEKHNIHYEIISEFDDENEKSENHINVIYYETESYNVR